MRGARGEIGRVLHIGEGERRRVERRAVGPGVDPDAAQARRLIEHARRSRARRRRSPPRTTPPTTRTPTGQRSTASTWVSPSAERVTRHAPAATSLVPAKTSHRSAPRASRGRGMGCACGSPRACITFARWLRPDGRLRGLGDRRGRTPAGALRGRRRGLRSRGGAARTPRRAPSSRAGARVAWPPRVYQRRGRRSSFRVRGRSSRACARRVEAVRGCLREPMPSHPPRTDRALLDAVRAGVLVVDGAMGTQLYERGVLYSACFEELNVVAARARRQGARGLRARRARRSSRRTRSARTRCASRSTGCRRACVELNAAAVQRRARGRRGGAGLRGGRHRAERVLPRRGAATDDLAKVQGGASPSRRARSSRRASTRSSSRRSARRPSCASRSRPRVEAAERQRARHRAACRSTRRAAWPTGRTPTRSRGSHARVGRERRRRQLLRRSDERARGGRADARASACPCSPSPNAGLPRRVDERMVYVSTPEYFGVYARRMFKLGVRLVGGCCGTTPEHVRSASPRRRAWPAPRRRSGERAATTTARAIDRRTVPVADRSPARPQPAALRRAERARARRSRRGASSSRSR